MNMLGYTNLTLDPSLAQSRTILVIRVPFVQSRDLRLNEIVIDPQRRRLSVCTGCQDNGGILDFDLYADDRACPNVMHAVTLRSALVFFDRDVRHGGLPGVPAHPTITVAAYRGQNLQNGELWLDPGSQTLHAGIDGVTFKLGITR